MQQNHFKEKIKSASTGLIISNRPKKLLSRQQQTFNNQIKKIEKLRSELAQVSKSLDQKLDFYGKHIYPLEKQLTELNKEVVKLLFSFFKNEKLLSKKERSDLGVIISDLLNNVFQFEESEPEEELKVIFKAVEGVSFEEAAEEDFDSMKNEIEFIFERFGVKMDLEGIHSKMTQEEMMKKVMEMGAQFTQQTNEDNQKRATGKKTKKQLEKEEKAKQVEEARSKNIGSIYKQLAKIFHPDLEQNEDLKLQKEELMKQLTNAYDNNDLHTLLNLELTWIQNEEKKTDKLTDDKLAIYNEVLKEQIRELENEIDATFDHPRYQCLCKFTMFPAEMEHINLGREKQQMEAVKNVMAQRLVKLKGNERQALSAVKSFIQDLRSNNRFNNDILDFLVDQEQ